MNGYFDGIVEVIDVNFLGLVSFSGLVAHVIHNFSIIIRMNYKIKIL